MGHPGDGYGELERTGELPVLHMSRKLSHPPARVWQALTEERHLAGWFPTTIEGEHVAGATLRFAFRGMEIPAMEGEMLACEPPALLEMSWGGDIVRFELRPEVEGTVLELTVTFQELGKAARDSAGWHVCLEQLDYLLDGQELPWRHADRWREVHPEYLERQGPDASTLGPPEEWERAQEDAGRN